MLLIKNITSFPSQKMFLTLPDQSQVELTLYYMPIQQCWMIESLIYGEIIINGIKITNNINILHQWKNILPFGIACYSETGREPSFVEDFESEFSKLYILTEEDILELETFING